LPPGKQSAINIFAQLLLIKNRQDPSLESLKVLAEQGEVVGSLEVIASNRA
jgi:hypothetical protein